MEKNAPPSTKSNIVSNEAKLYGTLPVSRIGKLENGKDPAVIIFNGTLCPIHAGHLNVITEATRYVNNLDKYQVIAGYVSPCHSSYANGKLGQYSILTRHRVNMIHLAIQSIDHWMIDLFESYADKHTEIYAILRHFIGRVAAQLSPLFGGKKITVFWLYGSDGLCMPPNKLMDEGLNILCVSNRGGEAKQKFDNLVKNFKELAKRLHFVDCPNLGVSSTAIRKACQIENLTARMTACQKLIGIDSVVKYLTENRLWMSAEQLNLINSSEIESPTRLAEINAEFLTKVFHEKEIISLNDSVVKFEKKLIGQKEGYSGFIYRLFNIEYSLNEDDQQVTGVKHKPASVIGKFASGISRRWIETEVMFFREVSPLTLMPHVPFCYYAAILGGGGRSFILMEDLHWAKTMRFDEGLPRDMILKVVDCMAEFHAEYWATPKLSKLFWLPQANDSNLANYLYQRYKVLWDSTKKEIARVATIDLVKLGDLLYKKGEFFLRNVCLELPTTYCHGDLWIYNIMLGKKPTAATLFEDPSQSDEISVAVIDWQTGYMGNGLIDIAFFLYISADPDEVDALEEIVLNRYYEQLLRFGVVKLTKEKFQEMYERALIYAFIKNFLGVSEVVISTTAPILPNKKLEASVKWKRILKSMERLSKVNIEKFC